MTKNGWCRANYHSDGKRRLKKSRYEGLGCVGLVCELTIHKPNTNVRFCLANFHCVAK